MCLLSWKFKSQKYEKDSKIFAACGGASVYRKSVFDEIGIFDDNHFAYLEDIDIGYRALIHGYHNYYCHSAVVYHAGSGFSGSRYNKFKIDLSAKNSIYLIYKNMPFLQVILNLPFLLAGFMIKTVFFALKGFGKTYITGLLQGFELSFSQTGRQHKVVFRGKHLIHYVAIQWHLWWNIVRRFIG